MSDTTALIILLVLGSLLAICVLFFVFESKLQKLYNDAYDWRIKRRIKKMFEARGMREHGFMAGEHIESAVRELVALANKYKEPVKADFNSVEIVAHPGDDPSELQAKWSADMDRKAEAYRDSPEGKRAAREAEERKQKLQAEADHVMSTLDELDFNDLGSVINWLEALRDPSDHIDVHFDRQRMLDAFADHGFKPSVYCGDEFDETDRETYARWLIGQALDNIQHVGTIHGVYHKFSKEWREKFSPSGAVC